LKVLEMERISLFNREINVFADRPVSFKEIIMNTVAQYGKKDALFLDGQKMTYEELDQLSNRLITALQNRYGLKKGDRLVSLVGNCLEFAIIVAACLKSGIVMVPVNTKLTAPEVAYIIGHSKPKVIIANQDLLGIIDEIKEKDEEVIPFTKNIIAVGETPSETTNLSALLEEKSEPVETEIAETDPAFILYTSGTTGRPKGAVLSHVNIIHSVMHYKLRFRSNNDMRTMLAVPFFHVTGLVAQFLQMVYVGGSMVILTHYNNEKYIQQSYNFNVNFHFNVPTIFIMMATSPLLKEYSFDNVKIVAFGGSPSYQQTLEKLMEIFPNASYHNCYGATETASPTTIMPAGFPISKATSVGRAVDTAELKVIDSDDRELGINEIGELLIKGPMVIGEYWDNPQANETSFVDGYWRSGDIAKIDEEGYVYILDRKKDMINRGGEKVYSIEVEDVLKRHPDIIEAAVVATPDPIFGERVKAIIVSNNLNEADQDSIRQYCSQFLAKFKIPEVYEFIDELPKTASGKVLKHTLR
jgi:long-chain acyl-CoA synthetase